MLFYNRSIDSTYDQLETGPEGLSRREAASRLIRDGRNEIRITGEPLWRKLAEPFLNVFMLVLFFAAFVSLVHGATFDAVIILVIMSTSALIYYIQRFSTERILRSLQKHTAQSVEVIRAGVSHDVDASELVAGDLIRLAEGDKVPADIRLTIASAVRVDESVLTGESVPVNKTTDPIGTKKEVYEQTNMLFQGSFIVSGQATGIVVFTGNTTEFGRIASLAKKTPDAATSPVQKKIDKLLTYIVVAVAGLAVGAFVLAISRGIELTEAIRFVLALSVSAVPESLPVAISVILVLGMRRMAAKKALVRTMTAIETIGVITTIATDKTGTLTENKLSVQEIWRSTSCSLDMTQTAYQATNRHDNKSRDPLDIAIIEYARSKDVSPTPGELISTLPFDQSVSMSGNVWHHQGHYQLVVKGAPEHILDASHLTHRDKQDAERALQKLTTSGYRVIALAIIPVDGPIDQFSQIHTKTPFQFVGFLAVADSLRPTARRAIVTAQRAGVTVRMITGDHFETAYHIGRQLGLIDTKEQVFDSRLMNDLTDMQLRERVEQARVFSRVTPENKYRILQILKSTEVTAMTGDGVNDVPALSSAHVGVAMGSGSQIAKDAGDIILLNDNFESIVRAMKEGRIIFANIRRMLFYLLSTNTGEAITMVASIAMGLPLPLAPVQILWVNLVTDTSMVIPLGLEPGEKRTMRMKPISPTAPLLSRYMISRIVVVALTMATIAISLYAYYNGRYGADYGQTIAFCALVVMQWANAFNARSTYESVFIRLKVWNKAFYIGLTISIILQVLAVFGPLQGLLHISPVALGDLFMTSILAFIVPIVVVEIHKFFGRRYIKNPIE
ncbi:cation-transporting P-type ATPase [Candidatus Saccharibacteria bacterium]|nr:cation-transporting P-type ATPase [Candidatus Saccharibacteria bacterium]